MTLPWTSPDGVEMLIVWLSSLAETRNERPTGSVLPFIMVRRVSGGEGLLVDNGRYAVSVFAATPDAAQSLSSTVHRKIKYLAGHLGQQRVTISSGDVYADDVITIEGFRPQEHLDDALPGKIYRLTAIYQIPLRVVAA